MKKKLSVFAHVASGSMQKFMSIHERITWRGILKRGTFRDVAFIMLVLALSLTGCSRKVHSFDYRNGDMRGVRFKSGVPGERRVGKIVVIAFIMISPYIYAQQLNNDR